MVLSEEFDRFVPYDLATESGIWTRAQTPAGKGLWPAFWLMRADKSPAPELDIMEMIGDRPTELVTNLHSNTGRGTGSISPLLKTSLMYQITFVRVPNCRLLERCAKWVLPFRHQKIVIPDLSINRTGQCIASAPQRQCEDPPDRPSQGDREQPGGVKGYIHQQGGCGGLRG